LAHASKDWVEFKIPDDARRIRAAIKRVDQGVRICNDDGAGSVEVFGSEPNSSPAFSHGAALNRSK
jgi:hypothetical protein